MLMWNPHWQCFVWDQHNCSDHVESALGLALEASDADFAAVVELEDASYIAPSRFASVQSACGHDLVTLIHNDRRWRRVFNATAGCMIENDRPFVVQTYENILNPYQRVIVVGAHFPHPTLDREVHRGDLRAYRKTAQLGKLRECLQAVIAGTGVEKVILIADTNAWDWVPSSEVMQGLGVSARAGWPAYLGTTLERTCCFDVGFPSWGTFDRVMANFGHEMLTSVLFQDVLPFWAQQVMGTGNATRKGAFHKPVVGTLLLGKSVAGHFTLSIGLSALGGAATVCVCLLLYGAGTWVTSSLDGKRRHPSDVGISDTESSASE